MASNDDLIRHVYDYFLKAYQGATGAPGGEILAFEPMGFSPGCVTIPGSNIGAAALQEVSQLADVLPEIDGGIYTHTGRTVSVQYATMIHMAQPSGADTAIFSGLKSQANKLYEDASSDGELDGPKATDATPVDWYDLTNSANWTHYSYDSAVQASAPVSTGVAPNVHLTWRVVPEQMRQQILRPPIEVRPSPAQPSPRAEFTTRQLVSVAPVAQLKPAAQRRAANFPARAAVARVAAQTTPQPVETNAFAITFDYCVVRLRRQWLSGDLLATPGWYVPGAQGGDYATGPPANTGWFGALPTAFITIKNLVIGGSWSANDEAAAASSAALGPFSLMGITASSQGKLSNPGMQIIAWICSPQPKMPPDSDPALADATQTQ